MTVRAEVVDIRGDAPRASDTFWIDSNVWFWVANAWPSTSTQMRPYLQYLKKLKERRATIVACGINFAEVAKCIEVHEQNVYEARNGIRQNQLGRKQFRALPAERANVIQAITTGWNIILGYVDSLSTAPIERACVATALSGFASGDLLDGHDSIQVAEARRNGVANFVTDDRDFGTVAGVKVFTANDRLIGDANANGLLVRNR